MTVPATARRAGPYNGNGSTTSFSFSFKTFAAGDLQVTRTSTTAIESVLVLNSDYSVTLNPDQDASPGGTITYPISGSPLAAGEKLTIVGSLAYEQTTDLLGGGAFNARVIEDTFDRTVIQIQQLEERADRTLTLPVSATASTVLPVPSANKVIAWNDTASGLVNRDATDFASAVAYANWRSDLFSGNGSTTQFTLSADPGSVNNMDVSIGGVTQVNGVNFTVSGTTLTFAVAPPAGTNNVLVRYGQALPVGTANASQVTFNPAGTLNTRSVQSKLRDVVSVFDFMTAAQIADVQAGTRLLNVTAEVQAAINFAAATTDRQRDLEFPQGDYAVSSIDFSACRQVTIICRGAVFITGVAAATNHIVVMAGSNEPTAVRAMKMIGTMAIQTALSSYQTGLYGRWIVDSQLNVSVSGSYSTAAVDLDVCFNNDWLWLYAVNTASTKPVVQFGTNNNNANRLRLRIAGAGAGAGQAGLVMTGNSNSVFGDISAVGTAVNLVAARGCTFHLYTEVVGRSFACTSGLSRGITIAGGTYEVASSSTAFDFSGGGSIQGLVISGVRFAGVSGGSARQAINWGGGSVYGASLIGHDLQNIDTEMTGTLRGGTGGVITQLIAALRVLSNGVSTWLGAWSDSAVLTTISAAGTTTPDASLGNLQWLTVTTTGAITIGAPTNPTLWQPLTLRIRNNSGGALGAITWNAAFKLAAWTSPANGQSRSITFRYDGASWVEEARTVSDIPN